MHRINRLQLELTCADEALAFDLRQRFSTVYQQLITDALEAACAGLAGDDEWLRIDRLDLNLGAFSGNSFKRDFEMALRPAFEKELREKIDRIPSEQKKDSALAAQLELWAYFFNKGALPWWGQNNDTDISSITKELARQQPDQLRQVIYSLADNQQFWQRIIFQLNAEAKAVVIELVENLQKLKMVFNRWMLQLNLPAAMRPGKLDAAVDLLVLKCTGVFFQGNDGVALLNSFENALDETILPGAAPVLETIAANRSDYLKIYGEEIPGTAVLKDKLPAAFEIAPFSSIAVPVDVAQQYYVYHAGIVLLAPFLTTFFNNLQLLEKGQWKNKEAQYRAIHLLKYLATGLQQAPEYELVLEKIVCGLAVEAPVPFEITLTAAECSEADELLLSVITHWSALKNTSVQGLQESFLKREGIIKPKETGWLLQIERKTVDVLTESIPWGYSIVAFPWNEYILYVEW